MRHRSGAGLIKKYPGFFLFNTSTTNYAKGAIDVLKEIEGRHQIGNKVAVVNVADDFGIELANAGRPLFKEAGFEIVYDKSYPLGTQDYTPIIKAARRPILNLSSHGPIRRILSASPSKPRSRAQGQSLLLRRGCGFQAFGGIAAAAENILGAGGAITSRRFSLSTRGTRKSPSVDADHWGSLINYECLETLTQSIEAVGTTDREAIADHVRKNKFTTIDGKIALPDQIMDKVYTVGQWQNGFSTA